MNTSPQPSFLNIRYGPLLADDLDLSSEGGRCESAARLARDLEEYLREGSYQREKARYALDAFTDLHMLLRGASYRTAAPAPYDDVFRPLELFLRPLYVMVNGVDQGAECLRASSAHFNAWKWLVDSLVCFRNRLHFALDALATTPASESAQEHVDFALNHFPQDYIDHLHRWAAAGVLATTAVFATKYVEPTNDPKVWLPPILDLDCLPRLVRACPTYPFNLYRALKNRAYRRAVQRGIENTRWKLHDIIKRMTEVLCAAAKS